MHIRCKNCHGTIWVEYQATAEQPLEFQCKECDQRYCVSGARRLRTGEARLAREARKIAETQGIDMPGAYSVQFGLLTPQEVRELGNTGSAVGRTGKQAAPVDSSDQNTYDPAFEPAIRAGFLSPYQAVQRGLRDTYAGLISNRHHIPLSAAYEIADNRISLLSQLRKASLSGRKDAPLTIRVKADHRPMWMGAGVVVAAAMVLVFIYSLPERTPAKLENRTVLGASVQTDHHGRILKVSGPSPRVVLSAYCASQPVRTYDALEVLPSNRDGAGDVRLGLLQERAEAKKLYMIQIIENRAAGEWVAGDGASPIQPKEAPAGAAALKPGAPS